MDLPRFGFHDDRLRPKAGVPPFHHVACPIASVALPARLTWAKDVGVMQNEPIYHYENGHDDKVRMRLKRANREPRTQLKFTKRYVAGNCDVPALIPPNGAGTSLPTIASCNPWCGQRWMACRRRRRAWPSLKRTPMFHAMLRHAPMKSSESQP